MSLRCSIATLLASALLVACGNDSEADETAGTTEASEASSSSGAETSFTEGFQTGTDTGIDPTDDSDSVGPASCDPQDDDCPDGFKCGGSFDFAGDPAYECVPVVGDAGPGELCDIDPAGMTSDTCEAGSFCLSDTMSSSGTCAAFCDANDSCGDLDDNCVSVFGIELPMCLPDCDPLDLSACPEGWSCREDQSERSWYCAPRLAGAEGGHGESCVPTGLGLCAPGFSCRSGPVVDAESCSDATDGSGCCAQFCNLDDDVACPSELEQCLPYYENGEAPPGRTSLGVCAVPIGE